jgi:prepilin-type N-terminal cleavage/methylation domain-containing protein
MIARRAMTLIELVAALALLALLVATSVPILQQSALALDVTAPPMSVDELGAVADLVMRDPTAFGIESLESIEHVAINWPTELQSEGEARPLVTIELLRAEEAIDHGWLRFGAGDAATVRWLKLQEQE